MPLTLYYHPLASYCHKVLITFYEHGIEYLDHHYACEFGIFDSSSVIAYTRAWSKSSKAPPSKTG